jgi:acetyl-CoA acyltransferase
MKHAVIVDAVRTPMGRSKGGMFRNRRAAGISADLVRGLLGRYPGLDPRTIDDVLWGCVQQTLEQGYNIARFIGLQAGLPQEVPAQTINRLCGSSMQALHTASMSIMAGQGDVYLCGGVEHMGHVPMSHGIDFDMVGSKFYAKASGMMGITAEMLAKVHSVSRADQDAFALRSHQRADAARRSGTFADEIIGIEGHDPEGSLTLCSEDEVIRGDTTLEALAKLPAVFDPRAGTVTAGNSSALSDGASCLLVMSEERARSLGYQPLAKVRAMASVGLSPAIMGYGPVAAVKKALQQARLEISDVGVFELNEAFAAQSLPVIRDLRLAERCDDLVNLNGGAIALGHPLGCSGSRITATLVHLMKKRQKQFGVAAMCIGFGQGIATVLEAMV